MTLYPIKKNIKKLKTPTTQLKSNNSIIHTMKMNKRDASKWYQSLSEEQKAELKQKNVQQTQARTNKKTDSESKCKAAHDARMKAQKDCKAKITQQINKCQNMRQKLIPLQMRFGQVKLKDLYDSYHNDYNNVCRSSKQYHLECLISAEMAKIIEEERILFNMQHRYKCIRSAVKECVAKTTALSKYDKKRMCGKTNLTNIYTWLNCYF